MIDITDLLGMFDEMVREESNTLESKGHDYANKDILSNFKEAAEFSGTSPLVVCRVMIGIKVARMKNLIGKKAMNESLEDTIKDLRNYLFFYKVLLSEIEDPQMKLPF